MQNIFQYDNVTSKASPQSYSKYLLNNEDNLYPNKSLNCANLEQRGYTTLGTLTTFFLKTLSPYSKSILISL